MRPHSGSRATSGTSVKSCTSAYVRTNSAATAGPFDTIAGSELIEG
jgi:hypothetical protein